MNNWVVLILGVVIGLGFGFSWGYNYGKKLMLDLVEQHIKSGRNPDLAVQYERDVLEGRIPRG